MYEIQICVMEIAYTLALSFKNLPDKLSFLTALMLHAFRRFEIAFDQTFFLLLDRHQCKVTFFSGKLNCFNVLQSFLEGFPQSMLSCFFQLNFELCYAPLYRFLPQYAILLI